MGENFNASLDIDSKGSRVTSDGGPILAWELDGRLGCGNMIEPHLTYPRQGKNIQLPVSYLLRRVWCGIS